MLLAGGWLFCAPFLLSHDESGAASAWHSHVIGAGVCVLAAMAMARARLWHHWLSLAIGFWLVVAPLVLGFPSKADQATSNHMLTGLLIGLNALGWLAMYGGERASEQWQSSSDRGRSASQ
ncbi:MAG: SPW repeat protein [Pseudomonadota bacterium]|nr:SPW repeat protein [Pseudomonadota bacterium]